MILEHARADQQEIDSLRQQLIKSQRLCSLGALTSSVAHELNNVLTLIINHAKLSLRAQTTEEDRTRGLEKILKSGQRACSIIQGMLGLARRKSDSVQPTDLVDLVEEMLVLTEKDLRKHQIKVVKRYVARPEVVINPAQIEQVILNLILNARQAMPRGGELRIEVRENDRARVAEIRIADRGLGIPKEKLPSIFEPFYTTKNPDDEGHGGTGLGLSVCRQIIEQHHGRIRVESMVGQGTIFTIKLPLPHHDAG